MRFPSEASMAILGLAMKLTMAHGDSSIRGQRSLTTIGECVAAIAVVHGVDEADEFRVSCETEDGNMYDVDGLDSDFVRTSVTSGALAPGDAIPSLNGKAVGLDGKIRSSSAAPGIEKRNDAANKRRLATVVGDKTVLAVMVTTAGDGAKYTQTPAKLENDVFLDSVSLATQYYACSHTKLNIIKAPDRTGNTGVTIQNGVVAITVPNSSTETDSAVRPAVTSALNTEFGTATGLANHLMYCLPPGTMSGIAYAYVNSWNSVYSDVWCNYVSAQMHELGHNLNLAHSGEGSTYDDQSGMMGFSYSQDDGPRMCFNNAKNWQLNWFSDAEVELSSPGSYNGPLKGQVNYVPGGDPVVIKINDSGSSTDYYVGFNHKVKHNSGTVEGGNQVTIQQAGEGNSYATSKLVAKLSAGGSWTSPTLSDGTTATVDVISIDTATETGAAQVSISVGGCTTAADCADGDLCTQDVCADGVCSNPLVDCDDGLLCTTDTCDPSTGQCSNAQIDCDDGSLCTTDSCNPTTGQCINDVTVTCDDGNACTTDTCDPADGQCKTSPKCDDGDLCTIDTCDAVTGQCSNTPKDCDDTDLCTIDTCNPSTGACSNVPKDCDDGNDCTTDTCNVNGECNNTPKDFCCGDGVCAGVTGDVTTEENCNNCPEDCATGTYGGSTCNNGICEVGEDCISCPGDCPGQTSGNPSRRFCCAGNPNGVTYGVGCDANDKCGGAACDPIPSESQDYCCGDGNCEGPETWAMCNGADCLQPAPTDAPDPTPAPVPAPTAACGTRNTPCNTNADCCNSCKGNGRCS